MRVISGCGGAPRTTSLRQIVDALQAGEELSVDQLDEFDTSRMEDYFPAPFAAGGRIAAGVYEAVTKEKNPHHPRPASDDTEVFYYINYLVSGGLLE